MFLLAGIAFAQDADEFPTLDAQLFRPSVDATQTLWTDDSGHIRDRDTQDWSLRGTLGWVHDPIVFYTAADERVGLLSNAVGMNVVGTLAYAERFRTGIDLPVYLVTTSAVHGSSGGTGDLAIDNRGTILDRDDAPLGLAAALRLSLPTAVVDQLANRRVGWELSAIADRKLVDDKLLVALNLGTRSAPRIDLPNVSWGNQFTYRLGGGYAVTNDAGVSADIAGRVGFASGFGGAAPAEVLLGGWMRPESGEPLVLRGGLGTGITGGIGAPVFRAVFSIAYEAPGVPDTDRDGIGDPDDQCPAIPEDYDAFEDEDGCLDEDNDGDGILDDPDGCPDLAEDLDEYQDDDGCPDPSTTVKVVITDPQGAPLPFALVEFDGPERHVDTSSEFDIPLHAGIYKVRIESDGYREATASIRIQDGVPTYDFVQKLEPAGELGKVSIRVATVDGKKVNATWETLGGVPSPIGPNGVVVKLIPGDHTLIIRAPGYAARRMPVNVIANDTSVLVVPLTVSQAELSDERIQLSANVQFESGSSTLLDESFPLLLEIATILADHPEIKKLRVEGHTDDSGSAAGNQKLSEERAAAVVSLLTELGVEEGRLTSQGFGSSKPLDESGSELAKSKNRRVEFIVEEKE